MNVWFGVHVDVLTWTCYYRMWAWLLVEVRADWAAQGMLYTH